MDAKEVLEKARERERNGKVDEAVELYERLVKHHPFSKEAEAAKACLHNIKNPRRVKEPVAARSEAPQRSPATPRRPRQYNVGKLIVLLLFGFFIWSLLQPSPSPSVSDKTRESVWLVKGKDAVKAKLKDPGSARFRNVFFHRGRDGIPMTCGEVNSKNSFGAYGGYQRFVSAGEPDRTYLEEQVADFAVVWRRFCE